MDTIIDLQKITIAVDELVNKVRPTEEILNNFFSAFSVTEREIARSMLIEKVLEIFSWDACVVQRKLGITEKTH